MNYTLVKQIKDTEILRNSFIQLAMETFDLSFESWYKNGYWTDKYIPYVLVENNKVIANASVNLIDTIWQGKEKRYIQIGTVMTDPAHRKQGLARRLLNEILTDWKDKSDAIYLYANDSVLEFYLKFGFKKELEYQYHMPISPRIGDFEMLDMDDISNKELLKRCYLKSNPFSALPLINNYGLLMFYCANFMKDCVYYSKQHDTVCVLEKDGGILTCFDIFGQPSVDLDTLLAELPSPEIEKVVLGFTPKKKEGYSCQLVEQDDTTLFVYANKENVFQKNDVMMPVLSHA